MPEVKMTKYMKMSSIWVLSGCQADGYRPIHQLQGIILIQNCFSQLIHYWLYDKKKAELKITTIYPRVTLILINLVIILTFNHTILVMLVQRIQHWIN